MMSSSSNQKRCFALPAAVLGAWLTIACGEAPCPFGSIAVGNRCEPAPECEPGEALDGGSCVAAIDSGPDAEPASETDGGDASSADASALPIPFESCRTLDCGDHGRCARANGEDRCECWGGFDGARCEACGDGLVLEDGKCFSRCTPDTAIDCNGHGLCDTSAAEPACICQHPYTGTTCAECVDGYSRRQDGTCVANCGECGVYEVCNDALSSQSCECAPGYDHGADHCEWVGDGTTAGLVNGELDGPSAWSVERVLIGEGRARFDNNDDGCVPSSISQTFTMPNRGDAEQMVLELDVDGTCGSSRGEDCPGLQVEIGSSIARIEVPGGDRVTTSLCLGDAAYGPAVTLTLRPSLPLQHGKAAFGCATAKWPEVHALRLRPANGVGECPASGTAAASVAAASGWISINPVEFSNGELLVTTRVATLVNLPRDVGYAISAIGKNAIIQVEGLDLAYLLDGVATLCLPAWTQGSVARIGFRPAEYGAKLYDFSVAPNAACRTPMPDPGFETTGVTRSWDVATSDSVGPPPAGVTAYSGGQVLNVTDSTAQAIMLTRIPVAPDMQGSIAFAAHARVVNGANQAVMGTVSYEFGMSREIDTSSESWSDGDAACVPPAWEGQLTSVHLSAKAALTTGNGTPRLVLDEVGFTSEGGCL